MAEGNGDKAHLSKMNLWLFALIGTIALSTATYLVGRIDNNGEKLSRTNEAVAGIQASRFKAEDGLKVWQQIGATQSQINEMAKDFVRSAEQINEIQRNNIILTRMVEASLAERGIEFPDTETKQ